VTAPRGIPFALRASPRLRADFVGAPWESRGSLVGYRTGVVDADPVTRPLR